MSESNSKVPAQWMSELGIKPGEWQYMTKPQLLSLMRPCCPLKTQVWACGMLYTIGYQGEVAVKMVKVCGVMKRVPLTPADISRKLHEVACEYYIAAKIADDGSFQKLKDSKEAIRRVLAELEDEGLADRRTLDGRSVSTLTPEESRRLPSGKTKLHFYAKPRWGKPEIAARTHAEALRALESSSLREQAKKNEVAENGPPNLSISKILKVFSVQAPDAETLKDPAYIERVSHAWEDARTLFYERLSVLPDVVPAATMAVAATGEPFVIEPVRESVRTPPSGERAFSTPQDARPPARPVDGFEERLKLYLLNRPIGKALDDPMFQRIKIHLTEELFEQFKTVADAISKPRGWPAYETAAQQVAARGPVTSQPAATSKAEAYAKRRQAEREKVS